MDALRHLDAAATEDARAALSRCCGSSRWVERMLAARPFGDANRLFATAHRVWEQLSPEDWREAFSHHPRIGDKEALRARFAATREWASGEQAGAMSASEEVLEALADGNQEYDRRFGHIFIVCATGKTAPEMLALLQKRLRNDAATELRIAAGEQAKITRLRLEKLLTREVTT